MPAVGNSAGSRHGRNSVFCWLEGTVPALVIAGEELCLQ